MKPTLTLEDYLEKLALFSGNEYGKMVRTQFQDIKGSAELAMLASPTTEELEQLKKAVAIMTKEEKQNPCNLTDKQLQSIACDAGIDSGIFAIFINGYILELKKNLND
jgi:signal recognition particle GTPase